LIDPVRRQGIADYTSTHECINGYNNTVRARDRSIQIRQRILTIVDRVEVLSSTRWANDVERDARGFKSLPYEPRFTDSVRASRFDCIICSLSSHP